MVIIDFISTNNLSARTKNINMQILEERKKIQEEIKGIKTKISQIEQTLELKAKQLVSTNFLIFALEDAETTKNELSNIKRELNSKQRRLELLKKMTIERLNIIIKKFRKRWHGIDNYEELSKFIYDLYSKIVITNEEIKSYINYDMITGKLCDFDIEIASIKRDIIMKIWRHNHIKDSI